MVWGEISFHRFICLRKQNNSWELGWETFRCSHDTKNVQIAGQKNCSVFVRTQGLQGTPNEVFVVLQNYRKCRIPSAVLRKRTLLPIIRGSAFVAVTSEKIIDNNQNHSIFVKDVQPMEKGASDCPTSVFTEIAIFFKIEMRIPVKSNNFGQSNRQQSRLLGFLVLNPISSYRQNANARFNPTAILWGRLSECASYRNVKFIKRRYRSQLTSLKYVVLNIALCEHFIFSENNFVLKIFWMFTTRNWEFSWFSV